MKIYIQNPELRRMDRTDEHGNADMPVAAAKA